MPADQPSVGGRHLEFLGWRPSDILRDVLSRRSERSPPRHTARLARRAFHTTGDVPTLSTGDAPIFATGASRSS